MLDYGETLAPCPRCGAKPKIICDQGFFAVRCMGCGRTMDGDPWRIQPGDAADAWNYWTDNTKANKETGND